MANKHQFLRNESISIFSIEIGSELFLPMLSAGISAGFPSPAMDFMDVSIDLNQLMIKHPSATFFGRVQGSSMLDAGISDGDLLVIDRSLPSANNKIAVCFIDGEFTIKRIQKEVDCCWLLPANEKYKPIKVTNENDFLVWGIVTHVIKKV
jgi:DNA polymerase V